MFVNDENTTQILKFIKIKLLSFIYAERIHTYHKKQKRRKIKREKKIYNSEFNIKGKKRFSIKFLFSFALCGH